MECEYIGAEVWMFTPEIDELNVPKCEEKCERSHLQGWSKCERSHLNQIPSDEHTREGSSEGVMTYQNCSWPSNTEGSSIINTNALNWLTP